MNECSRFSYFPHHTRGLQEGIMHLEGEERFPQTPQEVLEHTTHHIDVLHSLQEGRVPFGLQQTLLELLDHLIRATGERMER